MSPPLPAGLPAPPSEPGADETVAAVDLGSNSFHMVIARRVGQDVEILDRLREPVRLAAGLTDDHRLDAEAKARAIEALERFGQRLRDVPPSRVRAVGTNTLRLASRDVDFREAARRALGHRIEVISGDEEARLIWQGITHTHAGDGGRLLAVDIGGGSTEVMLGKGFDLRRSHSLYMGCVEYSRRFFPDGAIDRERFRRAETAVALELRAVRRGLRAMGWDAAVGASGTVHAIADILAAQPGGSPVIDLPRLKALRKSMGTSGSTGALDLPGLRPDRAPVLPGGLAILVGLFKNLKIETMRTAPGSLREGVLYDLVGRLAHRDVRDRTVRRFVDRYHVDLAQAERVRRTALGMFDSLGDDVRTDPAVARKLLTWAALLHEIGLVVSHSGYHKHGGYLTANTHLPGFSADDQQMLALLVRSHRRKVPIALVDELPPGRRDESWDLIVPLRLAVLLHRSRSADDVPPPLLARSGNVWTLRFPDGWLDHHPLTRVDLEREAEYLAAVGSGLEIAAD